MIREHFQNLHYKRLGHLEEIEEFLNTYLTEWMSEDINKETNQKQSKDLSSKCLSLKKKDRCAQCWIPSILKEDLISIVTNLFHKTENKATLPNVLYKARIILIPKPDKDMTTKLETKVFDDVKCKNSQQNTCNVIQEHMNNTLWTSGQTRLVNISNWLYFLRHGSISLSLEPPTCLSWLANACWRPHVYASAARGARRGMPAFNTGAEGLNQVLMQHSD